MTIWKCSNCGNEIPKGSKFCNHCGAQLVQFVVCSKCGKEAPIGSRFCPECGHPFVSYPSQISFNDGEDERNAAADNSSSESGDDSLGWNFNEEDESSNSDNASGVTPPPAPPAVAPQQPYYNDPQTAATPQLSSEAPAKKRRSYGHIWALLLTIVILGVAGYVYFAANEKISADEAVEKVDVPIGPDDAARIISNALGNELLGDVVMAMEVDTTAAGQKQVAGVTAFASNGNATISAYTLTHNNADNTWSITHHATRNAQRAVLCIDQRTIMGDNFEMPQHVTSISGKEYLFFTYALMPQDAMGNGTAVFALYNIATGDIVSVNYTGPTREVEGATVIAGKFADVRRSPESEFLIGNAQSAKITYTLSEQDLADEALEKALTQWINANSEASNIVRRGMETKFSIATYEQPIFTSDDADKATRIESAALMVIATDEGAVLGYSKTKQRYFVIFAPAQPKQRRAAVKFVDGECVRISTDDIDCVFDPHQRTATPVNPAFDPNFD